MDLFYITLPCINIPTVPVYRIQPNKFIQFHKICFELQNLIDERFLLKTELILGFVWLSLNHLVENFTNTIWT